MRTIHLTGTDLVGEENHGDGLICARNGHLGLDIVLPLGDSLEGRNTSDVKDDESSNSFLIVYLKDKSTHEHDFSLC